MIEQQPSPHAKGTLVLADTSLRIPLMQECVLIGRGEDADLRLIDGAVSNKHCQLEFDGQTWWITDLKSRNGTAVNGAPVHRKKLQKGDEILIAAVIRFRWEQEPVDPRAALGRRSLFANWKVWLGILAVLGVAAWLAWQTGLVR